MEQEKAVGMMNFIDTWVEFYLDVTIRGLISFAISLVIISALRIFLHLSILMTLVIAFMFSILISPLFTKIKLGHYILERYNKFLNRTIIKEKMIEEKFG